MPDHRPIDVQVDEQRKTALTDRLQSLSALEGDLEGVAFITARDIEEVFDTELELDYDSQFTATTPARGLIDMTCPQCHLTIPDVPVKVWSEQKREEGDGTSKVKLKFKTDAQVHVCGQIPLPKAPEVEGQTEAFTDDEPTPDLDPEDDE